MKQNHSHINDIRLGNAFKTGITLIIIFEGFCAFEKSLGYDKTIIV